MTKGDLNQIEGLLDRKFDQKLDQKLAPLTQKIDRIESQLDLVAIEVVKHGEDIKYMKENMLTVGDIQVFSKQQDDVIKIFKHFNDENSAAH